MVIPQLEITEIVLVHYNIVNNNYQQDSRVLYTFVPINHLVVYQKFLQKIMFLKKFNLEFQAIKVWFTDQNSQSLEIKGRINLTLVIK